MAEEGPQSEGSQPHIRPPTQGSGPGRGVPTPPGCETGGDSVLVSWRAGGPGCPLEGPCAASLSHRRTGSGLHAGHQPDERQGQTRRSRTVWLQARAGGAGPAALSGTDVCWPAPLLLRGVFPPPSWRAGA